MTPAAISIVKWVDSTNIKDDHMRNGQLKPGYNVQFAVSSGFITGIGVFSNRTDFGTLIPFLTYLWHKHGKSYRNVVADSGYESLANYRWLFENTTIQICVTCNNHKRGATLNCTPFVRQYDILSNKWGVLLCQKEYQTNDIRRSSREWL